MKSKAVFFFVAHMDHTLRSQTQTRLGGAKVLLTGQVAFAEAVKRAASGVEAGEKQEVFGFVGFAGLVVAPFCRFGFCKPNVCWFWKKQPPKTQNKPNVKEIRNLPPGLVFMIWCFSYMF